MKAFYLSIFFCASKPSSELHFVGERKGDELFNGKVLADEEEVGYIENGIISFVDSPLKWPSEEKIKKWKASQFIPRKWEQKLVETDPIGDKRATELTAIDGVILELAAGPGCGNVPAVLHRNPEAKLIINDISMDILQLWGEFFAEKDLGHNVCLAAFDARKQVIRSGSIAAISNRVGLSNIGCDRKTLPEVNRILRPGGMLFSKEFVVGPDGWFQIPEEARISWEENIPGFVLGYADLVEQAGLYVESRTIVPGRELTPEEDGVARFAAEYSVKLHASFEHLKARKPQ